MPIRYEDLNPHNGHSGYTVTNEEIPCHLELLAQIPDEVERGLGICSAGEVSMIACLPQVRNEMVLVDHSYKSLFWATLKYALLERSGWARGLAYLREGVTSATIQRAVDDMPPELTARSGNLAASYTYEGSEMQSIWRSLPDELVRRAVERFERVRFAHADLTDLIDRGPFDLLYLSNAMEHVNRHRTGSWESTVNSIDVELLTRLLRPGAYVIETRCGRHSRPPEPNMLDERFTLVHTLTKKASWINWTYKLFQVPVTT